MGNLESIFGKHGFCPEDFEEHRSVENQVKDAIRDFGWPSPSEIIIDGEVHRFPLKNKNDDTGWYRIYPDSLIPAGYVGDWRQGGSGFCFRANIGRPISLAEEMAIQKRQEQAKKIREEEREASYKEAAENALALWNSSGLADSSTGYCKKKGLSGGYGAKVSASGALMVAGYNDKDELSTIQIIPKEGKKIFFKDAKAGGCFFPIGELKNIIFLAEGFATAATIYEETGEFSVVSFSAGNLPKVAKIFKEKYPDKTIIIVADNDESGTGQKYAHIAANEIGARVIISPVEETDINDYREGGGDVKNLLLPNKKTFLVKASEFIKDKTPVAWHIKGWLQKNATIMVHGPSGCGKTFIVLDWVLHSAFSFEKWLDYIIKPSPIVYLAGEGHIGIKQRIAGWMQYHGVSGDFPMWVSEHGVDLNTNEGLFMVFEHIKDLPVKPGLVVVDTLHRFLKGNDSNSEDSKSMIDACDKIKREFGCSVILVHHTGVSSETQDRGRGSGAWRGALENEISIQPVSDKIRLRQVKMKDSEELDDHFVELRQIKLDEWVDEDGDDVTSAVILPSQKPQEKKNKTLTSDIKSITEAWRKNSGELIESGEPYITRSAWKNAIITNEGKTVAAAEKRVKPSGMASATRLISENIIKEFQHGFLIIDDEIISSITINNDK